MKEVGIVRWSNRCCAEVDIVERWALWRGWRCGEMGVAERWEQ